MNNLLSEGAAQQVAEADRLIESLLLPVFVFVAFRLTFGLAVKAGGG